MERLSHLKYLFFPESGKQLPAIRKGYRDRKDENDQWQIYGKQACIWGVLGEENVELLVQNGFDLSTLLQEFQWASAEYSLLEESSFAHLCGRGVHGCLWADGAFAEYRPYYCTESGGRK